MIWGRARPHPGLPALGPAPLPPRTGHGPQRILCQDTGSTGPALPKEPLTLTPRTRAPAASPPCRAWRGATPSSSARETECSGPTAPDPRPSLSWGTGTHVCSSVRSLPTPCRPHQRSADARPERVRRVARDARWRGGAPPPPRPAEPGAHLPGLTGVTSADTRQPSGPPARLPACPPAPGRAQTDTRGNEGMSPDGGASAARPQCRPDPVAPAQAPQVSEVLRWGPACPV